MSSDQEAHHLPELGYQQLDTGAQSEDEQDGDLKQKTDTQKEGADDENKETSENTETAEKGKAEKTVAKKATGAKPNVNKATAATTVKSTKPAGTTPASQSKKATTAEVVSPTAPVTLKQEIQSKAVGALKALTTFAATQLTDAAISAATDAAANALDDDSSDGNEKKSHNAKSLAAGKLAKVPAKKAVATTEDSAIARLWASPHLLPFKLSMGLLLAAAFMAGHHAYMTWLHDKDVLKTPLSQTLTVSSNIVFATSVKTFVVNAILACALKPMVRTTIKKNELTPQHIDALVALPAVSSIVSNPSLWRKQFVPIFLSIIATASTLITIRAPSALVTVKSPAVNKILSVSIPEWNNRLAQNNDENTNFIYSAQVRQGRYLQPTEIWDAMIISAITNPTAPSYAAPPECGTSCSYNLTYQAPALKCETLTSADIWDGQGEAPGSYKAVLRYVEGVESYLYNATTSIPTSFANATTGDVTLTVAYREFFKLQESNGTLADPAGAACTFYNATYNLAIGFGLPKPVGNETIAQQTNITSIDYLDQMNMDWTGRDLRLTDNTTGLVLEYQLDPTYIALANYLSPAQSFIQYLVGEVVWQEQTQIFQYNKTQVSKTPLVTINDALGLWNFGLDSSHPDRPFGDSLISLFTNATFSFLNPDGTGRINLPQTVNGTNASKVLIWQYTPWVAWEVYLPALVIAFLCTGIGAIYFVQGEIPTDGDFTQIFAVGKSIKDQGLKVGKEGFGTLKVGDMMRDLF